MKQDKFHKDARSMTMKKRVWLVTATATLALFAATNATFANGETYVEETAVGKTVAPPPGPFTADNITAPVQAAATPEGAYPPANFNPEKSTKPADDATTPPPAKGEHKWPAANQATTNEYPPKKGLDLTPAKKPEVTKPKLEYPSFPSVDYPKGADGKPIYPPFPSVPSASPQANAPGKVVTPPLPAAAYPTGADGKPIYPPFPSVPDQQPAAVPAAPAPVVSAPSRNAQPATPAPAAPAATPVQAAPQYAPPQGIQAQPVQPQGVGQPWTPRAPWGNPAWQGRQQFNPAAENQRARAAFEAQRAQQQKMNEEKGG